MSMACAVTSVTNMEWVHSVDPEWLKARKEVITATELVSMRTGKTKWTKDQKSGKEVIPSFAGLWAKKHCTVPDSPYSTGAAARGHILEPFAIQEYNDFTGSDFKHWDDCIIVNGMVGFSPDAMDIEQPAWSGVRLEVVKGKLANGDKSIQSPKEILEIKSYGAENHVKNMVLPKDRLSEKWQIAVAMLVLPKLEKGTLVQYCPQISEFGMFTRTWTRDELEDEIEELEEILSMWEKTCRWFANQEQQYPDLAWNDYTIWEASLPEAPLLVGDL